MKKYLFGLLFGILTAAGSHAQPIMSYGFESNVGTYREITDGIVLETPTGTAIQNQVFLGTAESAGNLTTGEGFPIGFDFVYNNQVMNRFGIGTHLFVVLGKDLITINPQRSAFFMIDTGSGKQNVIQTGVNTEISGGANTQISYKLEGNAPDRILVIQYRKLDLYLDMWGSDIKPVDMQIRLYEGSNNIEMIYNGWQEAVGSQSKMVRVGLKGADDDLHLRTAAADNWQNTVKAEDGSTINWNSDSNLADGLTFRFTACDDCVSPAAQPSSLTLSPTTTSVSGSFTASPSADHYLVVMTESPTMSAQPEDDVFYKSGDIIGNGTVVSFLSATEFRTNGTLNGARPYYFHIFGGNTFCMFGPKYNKQHPLTGSITTMPDAPAALTLRENGYERVTLNSVANAAGNRVVVAVTEEYARDNNNNITINGKFGQPSGAVNVGDELENGGRIVYVGNASDPITVEGLEHNNLYHFRAWSVDESQNYSTVGYDENVLTWAKVPFAPKFDQMPMAQAPFDWSETGGLFRLNYDSSHASYILECRIMAADPTNGKVNSITTPWVKLSDGTNRILFDLNMYIWARAGNIAYNNWDERDLFEVMISTDGERFTPVKTYTKENSPKFETAATFNRLYIPVEGFGGEKVKIKINWKCYNAVYLFLKDFEVEEKFACDYPVNLSVDPNSIAGDQALVDWISQGDESLWEMRYRPVGSEAWNEPFEVTGKPYLMKKLPTLTNIELQVRAKCSMTSQSEWSKPLTFQTGYSIPFSQELVGASAPSGWNFETGAIGEPTIFCTTSCTKQWKWSNSMTMKGLFLSGSASKADEWALMPVVNMEDGSANYTLNFDLKMTTPVDNDETYHLVISRDGGATFNLEDIAYTITKENLPAIGKTNSYSVSLQGYTGVIRTALYVKSTTAKPSTVQLVRVAFEATCPSDIVASVNDVTTENAQVSWTSEAGSWFVFIRPAGSTEKTYVETSEREMVFDELTPRTAYEVGITKKCAEDDMAKAVILEFTTLALDPCAQATDISVTESPYAATVNWSADAASYNFRYREAGSDSWVMKVVEDNTVSLVGLTPETVYEYEIQSVCSAAAGDHSEWTAIASFTTPEVSCFVPQNIRIEPTHKSGLVTWEGAAEQYEIGLRHGTGEWLETGVNGNSTELTALEAETNYAIRVRSICSENDASLWSGAVEFKTAAIPECVTPANLQITNLSFNAVRLQWNDHDSNIAWDLRYRAGSVTSWTNVTGLAANNHELYDLTENTAYLWSVKASCEEERVSNWATQNQFQTGLNGLDASSASTLKVYVAGNMLNVINEEHLWIESIQVYNHNGQLLNRYGVNSDENVLIPMNVTDTKAVVRIDGNGWSRQYQVIFK